jgi:Xaa-Pro aminopeptidase
MDTSSKTRLPFDSAHLDRLLDEAGIDILLVTSKHNIQYLTGGHRFFFHDYADAIGVSRYMPVLIYPRGKAEATTYIGNPMEAYERDKGIFWMSNLIFKGWGTIDAAQNTIAQISHLGGSKRIGVEKAFLAVDAYDMLRAAFPKADFIEAQFPLERLRAIKTPRELELLREASERVIESMMATIAAARPGMRKSDLVDALRREEISRDLIFEYCLSTAGTSLNRAPSDQMLKEGDILSLDSGGNYKGYIGDLCRMAILGEPDAELIDLLAEVEAIQQAARKLIRPGTRGSDIYTEPLRMIASSANKACLHFVAHGMGLVSHEAPRLTSNAPQRYEGYDAHLPLACGMVISIETTLAHPSRGFVKLEDTIAVTETSWESYGEGYRGWNHAGG